MQGPASPSGPLPAQRRHPRPAWRCSAAIGKQPLTRDVACPDVFMIGRRTFKTISSLQVEVMNELEVECWDVVCFRFGTKGLEELCAYHIPLKTFADWLKLSLSKSVPLRFSWAGTAQERAHSYDHCRSSGSPLRHEAALQSSGMAIWSTLEISKRPFLKTKRLARPSFLSKWTIYTAVAEEL
jgi:hypothetical protein